MIKHHTKNVITVLLILSIIFTSSGFSTFADSVDALVKRKEVSLNNETNRTLYTDIEDEIDNTYVASDNEAESEDDIISVASDCDAEPESDFEEEEPDESNDTIVPSTKSETTETDSEIIIDSIDEKYNIATKSKLSLSTYSEIDLLSEDLASYSELKLSSYSEFGLFNQPLIHGNADYNDGKKVWFGNYKQANADATDPIHWTVLTIENNKAFVLAERVLDVQPFGTTTTWNISEIKNWLETTFLNTAFDADERKAIIQVHHDDTHSDDKIFLLSKEELYRYHYVRSKTHQYNIDKQGDESVFASIWRAAWKEFNNIILDFDGEDFDSLYCKASNYAINVTTPKSLVAERSPNAPGTQIHVASYWLRSKVNNIFGSYVEYMDYEVPKLRGPIGFSDPSRDIYYTQFGIRPAMWIDLSSIYFNGKASKISFDYSGGKYQPEGTYQYMESYREGVTTELPSPADVIPPNNKLELAGWIYNANQTEPLSYITPDTKGDITAKAVWKNRNYNITWDLKDDFSQLYGSWDGDLPPKYYEANVGLNLPTNVIAPLGREFDHWEIDNKRSTSINANEERNITVKAHYRNVTYNIYFDLVDDVTGLSGYWDGDNHEGLKYQYSVGYKNLPMNVIAPQNKAFDHWEVGGIATTSIADVAYGDITLKASYSDTFWIGTFPQSDKGGIQQEPLKWRVVSVDGHRALLVTDKIIYTIPFGNGKSSNVVWKDSGIKKWLDDVFEKKAFSDIQSSKILYEILPTKVGSTVNTNGLEKVFILSNDETKEYFVNKDSLKAKATEYAKSNSEGCKITVDDKGFSSWWLRSESIDANHVDTINSKGNSDIYIYPDNNTIGIRPAFFYNLNSNIYKSSNNHVTFELNGGRWKDGSKLWEEFDAYQGGQKLPDATNIIPPDGDTFLGWVIQGENDLISEIAANQTGDIVLEAVYGSVWFGTYPQNDKTGVQEEPIKWNILKRNGDEVLLISDNVLDNVSYHHQDYTTTPWENSDVRSWLNNSFKNRAFTINQSNNGIATKSISTLNQNDTIDSLFLLSYDEANSYFSSDNSRKSKATEYAKNISNNGGKLSTNNGYGDYWLRTKGFSVSNSAQFVSANGDLFGSGAHVNNRTIGIRPVLYAKLNSDIFRLSNNNISFDLNGGSFKKESALWEKMWSYQGGQKLPTAENLIAPEGQEFLGWVYHGETATISEIEQNKTGDITLVAQWTNHPYHITWNLMDFVSNVEGRWIGPEGPDSYTYGVGLPTLPTNATISDVHRVFDHFEVLDSASSSCITRKDTGNKVIAAVYRNKDYDIIWDLEDGNTGNMGSFDGDHPTTYEYSVGISKLPTNVIGPTGREFDHWEIDGRRATSISETEDRTITIKAVYKNRIYNIYWSLGEGKWKNNYKGAATYEYSVGLTFPNGNNHIESPHGKTFSRWIMRFDGDPTMHIDGSISTTAYGDVEVTAEYANVTYNLTYQDEFGNPINWSGGVAGPSTYTYQTGIPHLPTNVIADGENEFDHWEISNLIVTGIAPNAYGDKVVTAMFKKKMYKITWHLDDIFGFTGDWDGTPGKDTYTYGTEYQLPTNIKPPKASSFSHWEINGVATTSIPRFATGDMEFRAVYIATLYNITWNLNGAEIRDQDSHCPSSYTYQQLNSFGGEIVLPDENLIASVPSGKEFSHFTINGVRATQILPGTIGDLTITLVYKGEDVHNITWDYGEGENHWEFDGWTPPATFSEGVPVSIPDVEYLYRTPGGREIDYFTVNGIEALEIDGNRDVVVTAVLKNVTYRIKYNIFEGEWDEEEGDDTYTHGTSYTLPTNIIPPRGKKFSHWEINGVATTSILPSDYGHKEYNAVYETGTYNIYWNLKKATVSITLPTEYTYGTEINLPDASIITPPTNKVFDYFTVNGVRTTKIDSMFAEDVSVVLMYVSYPITWNLYGGTFNYYNPVSMYEKGTEVELPVSYYIIPPKNKIFDYFTVNGVRATKISTSNAGAVTIDAIYKSNPSPSPSPSPRPYYPPSGGGGGRGGGGGGGGGVGIDQGLTTPLQNSAVNTTYLNQLKSASQTYDASHVVWIYDPVSSKFKINISMGDEIISVIDGFCSIKKAPTQNNGVTATNLNRVDIYCFKDGNMVTGWIKTADNKWYFMENAKNANEGQMVFGWKEINNKLYYFTADGSLLTNAVTPDGYKVDENGALIITT